MKATPSADRRPPLSVLISLLFVGACSSQERIGDFFYECARGWGMFDGVTCTAELAEHYYLSIWEDGSGPTIQYGEKDAHAQLVPPSGDDIVVEVGITERRIVAKTSVASSAVDHEWYLVEIGEKAPGMNWPLVRGPLTKEEIVAEFSDQVMPAMRRTR